MNERGEGCEGESIRNVCVEFNGGGLAEGSMDLICELIWSVTSRNNSSKPSFSTFPPDTNEVTKSRISLLAMR